jgi:hypothetical protein
VLDRLSLELYKKFVVDWIGGVVVSSMKMAVRKLSVAGGFNFAAEKTIA